MISRMNACSVVTILSSDDMLVQGGHSGHVSSGDQVDNVAPGVGTLDNISTGIGLVAATVWPFNY